MEKRELNQEGVLKEYIKLTDGYHDMYMYALTRKGFKM